MKKQLIELIAIALFNESMLSMHACRCLAGSVLDALKLKGHTVIGPENTHHEEPSKTHPPTVREHDDG